MVDPLEIRAALALLEAQILLYDVADPVGTWGHMVAARTQITAVLALFPRPVPPVA